MYQPMVLKYDLDDFEPLISRETMDIHYNKLYLNYLKNLNEALVKSNFSYAYPIRGLFRNISDFPLQDRGTIIYNAGAVINHELYFNSITTENNNVVPEPLNSALIKQFGSLSNFIKELTRKSLILTGSGYTFLTVNDNGELVLVNLSNQDSPYSYNLIPIMCIDVWEHSYFLDVFERRAEYVNNFLKFLNYNEMNKNYKNALLNIKQKL